jgi:hypothetical protein
MKSMGKIIFNAIEFTGNSNGVEISTKVIHATAVGSYPRSFPLLSFSF